MVVAVRTGVFAKAWTVWQAWWSYGGTTLSRGEFTVCECSSQRWEEAKRFIKLSGVLSGRTTPTRVQQSQDHILLLEPQLCRPSVEVASDVGSQAQVPLSESTSSVLEGCAETPGPRRSTWSTRVVPLERYGTPISF